MFQRVFPEFQKRLKVEHEGRMMEEMTRCVCGLQDVQSDDLGEGSLYIQCDHCLVWQHGFCVGFKSEKEIPEIYYCEVCRPDLHDEMYKTKISSKYDQSLQHTTDSLSKWKSLSLKKRSIIKETTYDVQLPKRPEKASSEPIENSEREKDILNKGKRRRNSDLPELLSIHETRRTRALSVSPQVSLTTQSNDSEEQTIVMKKQKKGTNMGIEVRKAPTKGRQNENKSKTKANEKKMKNVSDDNSDVTTNSSKSKQALPKTNIQDNANHPPLVEQRNRSKAKSKRTSATQHQHDIRQSQVQKDTEEYFFPNNVLNNIMDKPSRPRIPQAKITMTEMKRRVAAILEYIGRTQLEMASDEEHRKKLFLPLLEKIDKEIKDKKENFIDQLDRKNSNNSNDNTEPLADIKMMNNSLLQYNFDSLEMMDNLTKQLLEWEEKFGSYKDKNL